MWSPPVRVCACGSHQITATQAQWKKLFFTVPAESGLPAPGLVKGASGVENALNIRKTLWAWIVSHMGGTCVTVGSCVRMWIHVCRCILSSKYMYDMSSGASHVQFNGEELPSEEALEALGGPVTSDELYGVAVRLFGLPPAGGH